MAWYPYSISVLANGLSGVSAVFLIIKLIFLIAKTQAMKKELSNIERAALELFTEVKLSTLTDHLQSCLLDRYNQPDGAEDYEVKASKVADDFYLTYLVCDFLSKASEEVDKMMTEDLKERLKAQHTN